MHPGLLPGPSLPPFLPFPGDRGRSTRRGSGAKGAGSRPCPGPVPCPRSPRSRPARPRGWEHRTCSAEAAQRCRRHRISGISVSAGRGQGSASSAPGQGRSGEASQSVSCGERAKSCTLEWTRRETDEEECPRNEDRQETPPVSPGAKTPKHKARWASRWQGQPEEATALVTRGLPSASPRGTDSARQCRSRRRPPAPHARSPHLGSGSALPAALAEPHVQVRRREGRAGGVPGQRGRHVTSGKGGGAGTTKAKPARGPEGSGGGRAGSARGAAAAGAGTAVPFASPGGHQLQEAERCLPSLPSSCKPWSQGRCRCLSV